MQTKAQQRDNFLISLVHEIGRLKDDHPGTVDHQAGGGDQ